MEGEQEGDYINLISEDNRSVRTSRSCLKQIGLLNNILRTGIDDIASIKSLPLTKIKYPILVKIAEYLEQHADDPVSKERNEKRGNDGNGSSNNGITDHFKKPNLAFSPSSNPSFLVKSNNKNEENDSEDIDDQNSNSEKQSISEEDEDNYFLEYIRNTHSNWDEKWIKSIDIPTLIEICRAANYLYMNELLDLTCQAIADHMKGLDVEGIRKKFNIENDFTPQEEARIKEEFAWAEE